MKEKRDTQRDINVLLQLCDDIDICNGHRVLVIDSLIIVFAAFNRHEEVNLCVDVCVCVHFKFVHFVCARGQWKLCGNHHNEGDDDHYRHTHTHTQTYTIEAYNWSRDKYFCAGNSCAVVRTMRAIIPQ